MPTCTSPSARRWGATGTPKMSPRPCCSSPPGRTSSQGSCLAWMAGWGCRGWCAPQEGLLSRQRRGHALPPVGFLHLVRQSLGLLFHLELLAEKDGKRIGDAQRVRRSEERRVGKE